MLQSAQHDLFPDFAMQPDVTIEPASIDDVPRVQRLANDIWRRHYPGILSRAQIEYMLHRGYSREALLPFIGTADAGLATAARNGAAIGFIAWYKPDARPVMKLDKLYVLPENHGEGVGRALIEHVLERATAAGCSSVTLNVNRRNARSIRAYERSGFDIRGSGDFPIGDGFVMEDFIMVREL